jgi:hypothetical protein
MVDRLLLQSADSAGYLYVPGAAGDKADTPDHADFAIAGDIDVRVLAAADDWTPSGNRTFVSQWQGIGSDRAWAFQLTPTRLQLLWSVAGTTVITKTSTVTPGGTDGQPLWCRFTLDVDNGAAGNDLKFYTSADPITTEPESVTWAQLGTTVTTAGVTSIHDSAWAVTMGALVDDTNVFQGRVYYAEVRNGIGGTIVANPDLRGSAQQTSATSLTDSYSKPWTVRGAASWLPSPAVNSYLLEDDSGILLLESSVPDIPYTNPMPQLLAQ